MMRGRIWVESEPGKGSTFHFTVHLCTPPAAPGNTESLDAPCLVPEEGVHTSSSPHPPALRLQKKETSGYRVLLAEDNAVNRTLAVRLLERQGYEVSVCADGRAAIAAVEEAPFDFILMDVQMPDMDGLQATAAIRKLEESTGRHIPIVAMTAHAMKGDREKCLAAGMDGYVSKPIHKAELFAAIETLIGDRPLEQNPREPKGPLLVASRDEPTLQHSKTPAACLLK
jgi:CheY-like chemotaxis protein